MFYTTREMLLFQERKKLRKILYSKVTLILLLFFVILVARGTWKIHQKAIIAQTERDEAARAVEELNLRAEGLEKTLVRLRTPEGAEEEARQKYTVARSSEEVVIVVDVDAKKSKNSGELKESSFWDKLKRFLKGEWEE